ncbi:polysaccharide biosynthesis tyrosine autokinase [Gordonia sputi]
MASQQRVLSYAKLANSDAVVQRAIRQSGINIEPSQLKDSIHADSSKDTVLLVLSVDNSDPDKAEALGNAVANSLVDYVADIERPTTESAPQARLTVVSPATRESSPVSPNVLRNIALGGLSGAVVGVGIAFWRVRMDRVLRTPSQLEDSGRVVLARVPSFQDAELGPRGVVDFHSGSSPAAEAYRKLRTNILLANVDNQVRQIVVSSSGPADGKSETALNLAVSLAEAGKTSILVDADLRRPVLADRLGLANSVGVTEYLGSDSSLSNFIQDTDVDGLRLLASGRVPPNPAELLGSEKALAMFAELRSSFDYVIIDSPPVLPVTDAVIAAEGSDGVVVVVRMGASTISDLSLAFAEFERAGALVLGVVANDVDVVDFGYQGLSYAYGFSPADSWRS